MSDISQISCVAFSGIWPVQPSISSLRWEAFTNHKPILSNSTICRIWIFCGISGICPSVFKINTEPKLRRTYKFLFYHVQENWTVEWLDMRRERLLSPSAFGKYGKFSLFQNLVEVADSIDLSVCSILPQVCTITLDWLPWDCAWERFQKNLHKDIGIWTNFISFYFSFCESKSDSNFFCA